MALEVFVWSWKDPREFLPELKVDCASERLKMKVNTWKCTVDLAC